MLLLNYKPVLHQPTGIGVYANGVFPVFNQFEHILIPGGGSGGTKERLKRLVWSQFQLPKLARERKVDLIFTPAPEGYLGEQVVPQVVMVHDLRPLSHPERSVQSLYFRNWVPPLLRQCRHIITNSEFTASEIGRATAVPEDKISVTPLGYASDHFYPSEVKRQMHSRPYLLHVGQAYPHKNLQRLIVAFKMVAQRFPEVDLLLLGKPHPFETLRLQKLTSEAGLRDRVIFKSYVPYGDLPDWYRGALAFVYPSLWEGFGLPILEAMACGCPVITSYGSGMQEIAGDVAILINPLDTLGLSKAIVQIIEEKSSNRYQTALLGIRHANRYSWKSTQKMTLKILSQII